MTPPFVLGIMLGDGKLEAAADVGGAVICGCETFTEIDGDALGRPVGEIATALCKTPASTNTDEKNIQDIDGFSNSNWRYCLDFSKRYPFYIYAMDSPSTS